MSHRSYSNQGPILDEPGMSARSDESSSNSPESLIDCPETVRESTASSRPSAGRRFPSSRRAMDNDWDSLRCILVENEGMDTITNDLMSSMRVDIDDYSNARGRFDEPGVSIDTSSDDGPTPGASLVWYRHWVSDEVPFSGFGGGGGGRSYSQIDDTVSETTLSPRMKDFNSKGGAIDTAAVNSHQSPASEGTVAGSILPPESECDIQDLSRPKAFDSCGASETMQSFVENTKSKGGTHSANGFRESTITTTAELRSETETELLKNNEGFGPSEPPSNFACESPDSKGESIPEDVKEATKIIAVTADVTSDSVDRPKAVGVHGILTKPYKVWDIKHSIINKFRTRGCHQSETVDRDMSSSTSSDFHSSESEQMGSDDTTDELCSHLKDVHVDGDLIMTPILDPARQAMVDRVMAQFWVIFKQQWPSNIRQHIGTSYQESETVGSIPPKQRTAQSRSFQRKRQRKDEEEDSDRGDDRIPQPPSQSTPPANGLTERPKFACMFRKHDPCRYSIYSYRSCALSHWPSIARVKEHLNRKHQMAPYCERCWQTFDNQQILNAHITVDATEICQVKPGHPPDGLTPEMERKLRSRKKAHRDQTDEDRWRDMYRLLFPNEDVPSPYFEPMQDGTPLSPDSRDLANYEEYARRELPRLVRASVLEVFSQEMQPVEASLIANLVDTIQDCQARLFRSYLERINEDQQADIPSVSMTDAPISPPSPSPRDPSLGLQYPSVERTSMHTPSNFLNAAFQQPPPLQDPTFEPNFQSHESMHGPQSSNTIGASLSSLSETVFSSHGYGSEHTAATDSSQSKAADSTCPQGGPDSQDDTFRWQDWNNEPSWG